VAFLHDLYSLVVCAFAVWLSYVSFVAGLICTFFAYMMLGLSHFFYMIFALYSYTRFAALLSYMISIIVSYMRFAE